MDQCIIKFIKGRIEFICMDGRKGIKEKGPFDVIHVGGALNIIPVELED